MFTYFNLTVWVGGKNIKQRLKIVQGDDPITFWAQNFAKYYVLFYLLKHIEHGFNNSLSSYHVGMFLLNDYYLYCGSYFLVFYMPSNFLLDVKHCDFYLVR